MLNTSGLKPHTPFGQGKRATTLLTEGGYFYPVISHDAYNDRLTRTQSAPVRVRRGSRLMHRTTFTIGKAPWNPETAHITTSKENFGGSKTLKPVRRPPLCPSMHTSQIKFGRPQELDPNVWNSHYTGTFIEKPIVPANRLHLTSLVNRTDQTEGIEMKKVVKIESGPYVNFTQYNRIHNKLGHMLGPGVPREYPVRQEYNVITGEEGGPAWYEDNRRVSGNRVLHNKRKEPALLLG